ncbi:glycosyltransferase family 2 protein [Phocaeicola plebeius]|uniref:glycosyltransferase family 2 protein n=1 Tax=Phocaeicola plebeius TaxID=310297 RepID=UPI0026EA24DA|nr:glycosyltransferase family 2 protein [Phocaeicola plebeius]
MSGDVLYSIITPVYNRGDCVARCIESVIRNLNRDSNIEHIIVDDGSSDDSASIIEDYALRYSHIHFLKFSKNRGVNAARNAAINVAKGAWCIILDSDDYFVDDALLTISKTMKEQPQYKHYMFAPDDMQVYFQENPIIKGVKQKVLLYPDFLNGYIGGDFIHVCNTPILRNHPFDERLRIYEGLFFLMFYRDAQKMLFTNKVVTIRERNREDSVSKDFLRISDTVIKRTILSNVIFLKEFESDLVSLGMQKRLQTTYLELLDNYVLVGMYEEANNLIAKITINNDKKYRILSFVTRFRIGQVYKLLLRLYLYLRYYVLKSKMKV